MVVVVLDLVDLCLLFLAPHAFALTSRLGDRLLASLLGAHDDLRDQPLEVLPLTERTRRCVSSPNKLLELMTAASALILVDGHTM